MDFNSVIAMRCSTRAYEGLQLSDDELNNILAAGCAAPVGMGAYKNYQLTVLQDKNIFESINSYLSELSGNPSSPFYSAPTVIFVSAAENSRIPNIQYADVACIIENMHLAATNLHLGSVYLFGCISVINENNDLVKKLKIPTNHRLLSALAVGHPVKELKERELTRKILVEIIK